MNLDPDACADIIHLLVRLALKRDLPNLALQQFRKPSADRPDMRSDLRALANHSYVDVADPPACRPDFGDDALKQF